ncbi:isocitrate lyase/PEP mutase family protein [Chryseosolibacter indicus]|uniref:Isocitrate lyase/PEP mutase family protein n=1 Tax=Chryseosolibacter indicus TaxID=2782351 RepID=A0ABS5VMZ9_9BACT|nr:isocitrate lyase/phosphoenolpyruvate mutase family protein [Chryseosolibacter indicus]MBT1702819.1 isocitrate lyase/PEP mutase family protein [Chryseosolibacter indicus]
MNSQVKVFRELHRQSEPLLLANVWDVQSAKVFEKQKFKAIGTSSAAVAQTLGYNDGEEMPFDEYFLMIKRIKASTTIPLTVDLEAGYGKTEDEIVSNIKALHELGVVGINIEDSIVTNSVRTIVSAESFAERLKKLISRLHEEDIDIFINVRCDAFLLNLTDAKNEAIRRTSAYGKTGVHGFFLPCITNVDDIKATTAATTLPVNVMCMPNLPGFNVLKTAGVKRISMGPFLNKAVYQRMEELCQQVVEEQTFSVLF